MEGEEDDTSPLILVATRLVEALNVAKIIKINFQVGSIS